jgi:mannose-6-phosphate isomerase-like protein (cupin superfamily)
MPSEPPEATIETLIVQPGQGRVLDLGSFQAVVLAAGAQTGGAFTLLQTQGEPEGFGPPLHIHHDAAEAFFVLEGEYLMVVEDHQEVCPPGTFVYVPAGVRHTFQVRSGAAGRKLNLFAPAAMESFFEELSVAEAAGTADEATLGEIASRAHMEIVGPVPESYL